MTHETIEDEHTVGVVMSEEASSATIAPGIQLVSATGYGIALELLEGSRPQ
jgi:hypothetical protein